MSKKDTWIWIGMGAGALALVYYGQSQGWFPQARQATPLSVYPELAYTAQTATTSMAATPQQQATAATLPPTPLYSSVQLSEANAIYGQCIGANVCTPLSGDTQLGL